MSSVFGSFGMGNSGSNAGTDRPQVKLFPNRIFVGGMSRETTEEDLSQLFSNYGQVKSTKIITDTDGCSKGYGFVTFASEEEAHRVQLATFEIILHNRKLNIGPAMKRNLTVVPEIKADNIPNFSNFLPFLATASTTSSDGMVPQPMFPYYGIPLNFPCGIPYPTPNGISYQYPF